MFPRKHITVANNVETTIISLFLAEALIRICFPFFKGEF